MPGNAKEAGVCTFSSSVKNSPVWVLFGYIHLCALELVIGVCLLRSESMIHYRVRAYTPYVWGLWDGR